MGKRVVTLIVLTTCIFNAIMAQDLKAKSLHFNGIDNYIALLNNPKLEIENGTIEIWMKTNDSTQKEFHSLVSKTLAYQISLHKFKLATFDWKIREIHSFGPALNDNKWHHVAFVFKNGVKEGSQLFLDGKKIGTPFTYSILYTKNELQIGANNFEPQYFKGYLDEFRLWNTARTELEIASNYTQELKGSEEGLVVYYKLNDGLGNANNFDVAFAEDETSNHLLGKLIKFNLKDSVSNYTLLSVVKATNENNFLKFYRKNKRLLSIVIAAIGIFIFILYTRNKILLRRNSLLSSLVLEKTAELNKSLSQKEILLQELHHRVKNNLQIIYNLLLFEIDNNLNSEQKKPLLNTARRLYCMSLVHEQLYSEETLEKVDANKYIKDLVTSINEMVNTNAQTISFQLNIDTIVMQVSECLSVGFIISEMVSNSIQHAFDISNNPTIEIELTNSENNMTKLSIKDNGLGIKNDDLLELKRSNFTKTLGMRLVSVFSRQLNGQFTFLVDNGFGVLVEFKLKK